jgi:hypothetical protein
VTSELVNAFDTREVGTQSGPRPMPTNFVVNSSPRSVVTIQRELSSSQRISSTLV